jgi:hypothetical protein
MNRLERFADPPPAMALRWCAPASCMPSGATRRLCHLIALATAAAFAVPVGEVAATTRRTHYVAFARQSAMYVAHVAFGLSYSEVGRAFGRDRTTAAYACRLIEDRRDDPAVDAVLASLENACRALCLRRGASVQP